MWFGPMPTKARPGGSTGGVVGCLYATQSGALGSNVDEAPRQEIHGVSIGRDQRWFQDRFQPFRVGERASVVSKEEHAFSGGQRPRSQ